jgi:hypothetical protein
MCKEKNNPANDIPEDFPEIKSEKLFFLTGKFHRLPETGLNVSKKKYFYHANC